MHYPIWVEVQAPDGTSLRYVVKKGSSVERIEREARTLRALDTLGFPVPSVIAGPISSADQSETAGIILLTELPGRRLPWVGAITLGEADLTCGLVIEGVRRLHQLTEPVEHHELAATLPRHTLLAELDDVGRRAGAWLSCPLFARAVADLRVVLPSVTTRLVFSNGDYNPLNFLHDGTALTGFVDFESACFEDPHIGFAKFLLWSTDEYGWGAGKKAGLVERYLYAQDVSRREFAPRLALRTLRHLLDEVSPNGEADAAQRRHMLEILSDALDTMSGAGSGVVARPSATPSA